MNILVVDKTEIGQTAANIIEKELQTHPSASFGLATGSSVDSVYGELISRYQDSSKEQQLSWSQASAFLLDEYVGLALEHPQAYHNVIRNQFVNHIDIPETSVHGPDLTISDANTAAEAYNKIIQSANIDIQLLGIGRNGHIAFNEPGAELNSSTRVVELSETTRVDNARFFDSLEDVPHNAITQGIGTILSARQIIIIAQGEAKAAATAAAIDGPMIAVTPASALQLHPKITWILDEAAAALLQ